MDGYKNLTLAINDYAKKNGICDYCSEQEEIMGVISVISDETKGFDINSDKGDLERRMHSIMMRLLVVVFNHGIDLEKMQPCRYYRSFEYFSYVENSFALCKGLCRETICLEKRIQFAIEYVRNWSRQMGIDIDYSILGMEGAKMESAL